MKRPRVNVQLSRVQLLRFTRDLPYIAFVLFTRVKFARERTEKLRDTGNPP